MSHASCALLLAAALIGCADSRLDAYHRALEWLAIGNFPPALQSFTALANNGYAPAQFRLGLMYLHGFGVEENHRQAAQWFYKAAQQGDIAGQYSLARLYLRGVGVPQSEAHAMHWLRGLAERGFVPAQYQIGLMYADSRGTAQNPTQALKWLRRAAESRHRKATLLLAEAYRSGLLGLVKDPQRARYWEEQARLEAFSF